MTKRLIEVDDGKLEAVREVLGTRTLKATVDEAFDAVLGLDQRRRALLAERGAVKSQRVVYEIVGCDVISSASS